MITLLRFWPDTWEIVAAAQLRPNAQRPPEAQPLRAFVPLTGAFDLAIVTGDDEREAAAGEAALDLAWAIARGRFGRDSAGWWAAPRTGGTASTTSGMFSAVPAGTGVGLFRAMDGWVMMAAADREALKAMTMTFLRKHLYFEHDEQTAWRSDRVNELAALVVATHRAEDVEGTCETYGIPCRCLVTWCDEEQAAPGGTLEGTPSGLLASLLHYGSLLGGGEARPGESGESLVRRRLREVGAGTITVASFSGNA